MFHKVVFALFTALAVMATGAACSFGPERTSRPATSFYALDGRQYPVAIRCENADEKDPIVISPRECSGGLTISVSIPFEVYEQIMMQLDGRSYWEWQLVGKAGQAYVDSSAIRPESVQANITGGSTPTVRFDLDKQLQPSGDPCLDFRSALSSGKLVINAPPEIIKSLGLTPVT